MESTPVREEGSSPELTRPRMFSVRIVHLDYYMAAPLPGMDECYSHFQGRGVLQVPVVRIFGSTTSGQKTCLHLHKAFPYFYVSYDDDLPQEVNEALAYVRRLASAVEKACKIASSMGAKRQHVHSCSLVRGRKYYGYYPEEQLFIKIVLYYPQEISRISTLLLSGAIMNHKFQPYESHIPYLLQILIDYNLYGMGHIHVSRLKFRNPLPQGPSNLTGVVKQVKSEFSCKTTSTAVEIQNQDLLVLNTAHLKEVDPQPKQVNPTSDLSMQEKKDELPNTCPVVKLVSPGSNQSTPVPENQQDLWLHRNVPGEWVWPIPTSSPGSLVPYSRQSTCELEADASVADILNRGELLFRPLQQTGPEIKMVQSLTPIWEEELLRTGESGPAGPVNAQYQSTTRIVPPASSLEEAMRDALFQIANAEEHQVKPSSDRPNFTLQSDEAIRRAETREEPNQNLEDEPMVPSTFAADRYSVPLTESKTLREQKSVPSFQGPAAKFLARGSLLQCTQLANGGNMLVSPESHPMLNSHMQMTNRGSSEGLGTQLVSDAGNTREQPAFVDDSDEITVNEEAIMSHLSQRLQSQELDNEAAELLRWLGATQDAGDATHERKGAEVALTQILSSPGMDSALLQALADYETATEQECQAILDCVSVDKEEEEAYSDADASPWGHAHSKGDKKDKTGLIASLGSTSRTHVTETLEGKIERKDYSANIPQIDGTGDEESSEDKVDYDELFFPSRECRIDSETATASQVNSKTREHLERLSGEENKEVSLREMMRRRRDRRPRKKESSFSPSPLSGDTMESVEQGNLKESSSCVSRLEKVHRIGNNSAMGILDDTALEVQSRRKSGFSATTTGSKTAKYSDYDKKGKSRPATYRKHQPKTLKYTALPVVKVNSESSHFDTHIQTIQEMDTEISGDESNEALLSTDQRGNSNSLQYPTERVDGQPVNNRSACNEHYMKEDKCNLNSCGDDRDCGGGDGPLTIAQKEIGEERTHDVDLGKWSEGTSMVIRQQTSETHSVKTEMDEHSRRMQCAGVGDIPMELSKDSKLNSTRNIGKPQSNCRQNLESSYSGLENFSEATKVVVGDRSIAESVSQVFVPKTTSTSEVKQAYPVNEQSSDNEVSVLSRLPDTIGKGRQPDGVDIGAGHSTQYLFTDMSDESQESFDSGEGGWARESYWDAPEALFGDQGYEEIQSIHALEQSHLERCSRGENRWNENVMASQEQIAVGSTAREPLVSGLSARKGNAALELEGFDSSTKVGYLDGPSLFTQTAGQSVSRGTLGQSTMFTSMNSPSPVNIPEVAHDHPAPFFQSGVNLKASQQDTEAFSSSLVKVDIHSQAAVVEPVVYGETKSSLNTGATNCDQRIGYPSLGQTFKGAVSSSFDVDDEQEHLYPLVFHQRPPDREQLLANYKELAPNFREEGGVYYGNVKDVSDRPTIMAGLIFDVKSRDAVHLRPFEFGGLRKKSKFEQRSKSRQYIEQEYWGTEDEMDSVVGISSHFENDGTPSYLITPAKSPPSALAVRQWAASMKSVLGAEKINVAHAGREQMFTMDANTGKLVPLIDIASAKNSQESLPGLDSPLEHAAYERPASPKYDERHVLNLTHQSFAPPAKKDSQRKPGTVNQSERICKEPYVTAATEQPLCDHHLERPLVPFTGQTSQPELSSPENKPTDELLKEANAVTTTDNLPQDQHIKQPPGNMFPKSQRNWRDVSQMTAISPPGRPTPLSQAGFRDPASIGGGQQTTLMSIEVFAETRGDLLPDPRYDAINCIVIAMCEDAGKADNVTLTIVLIRDNEAHTTGRLVDGIRGSETVYLPDEAGLLNCFARLVRQCDPDILLGWEIQGYSLGLVAERAANLGISLLKQLSRMPPVSISSTEVPEKDTSLEDVSDLFDKLPLETKGGDEPIIEDEWGRTHGSGLHVGGRIVLNLWRIMRGEVRLGIYSLESVAEAVLRRRVPRIPWRTLTRWFSQGPGGGRFHCLEYFIDRARLNLQIMEQLDLINRTAELARVFGIDFYSVFSRGSQFRVESMMARLAHTQNFTLVSPTRQQVADQPAMECLPLVMEPESRLYTSPVIVLDFQSLYPSMIIAYNLCYSTCLGKLVPDNPKTFGVSKLSVQPGLLDSLKESMTITPNGVMFVPSEVRPGVLPRLLQEILSTRIMVKKAMKQLSPEQKVLQRVLNARQFALKLIANVTYGYTAAGFSGRMPCAEIADSIVQCGRLTLERAIHLVNSHPRWGGRVVYGDTDSMFVLMEGRTREEAHAIGQEIAAAVTEMNPPPVALKMEKVYHPCVLLTKKRYVGYSYESAAQLKPMFDAKGIETIRRDSCPAVAKTLEHSLRILFESQDLSQVKQYLQRQWGKILSGRISLQDFIFAKEVRLGTYSARSPVLPPAAIVASKAMAVDPRAEPRYAERIPYVVVHGEPGARLVDMVVDPLTLIDQPSLRLHDTYYITKQIIPACQRIFMLVGVDLKAWFSEMPRIYRPPVSKRVSTLAVGTRSTKWDPEAAKKKQRVGGGLKHGTIDQYYLSRHCTVCGEFTRASQLLCGDCSQDPGVPAILLPGRTSRLERELNHLSAICRHCGGGDGCAGASVVCISLDCSVFFERRKVYRELQAAGAVALDLGYYPPCLPELF